MGDNWLGEESMPPCKVLIGALGRGARLERTTVEHGEHGLQSGEVSVAHWDNKACVEKLAIHTLDVCQGMHRAGFPRGDCRNVLGLFGVRDGDCEHGQVPGEADEGYQRAERDVLQGLPGNAEARGHQCLPGSASTLHRQVTGGSSGFWERSRMGKGGVPSLFVTRLRQLPLDVMCISLGKFTACKFAFGLLPLSI